MKINLYPYVRAVQSVFTLSLGCNVATSDAKIVHPTKPGEKILVQVFSLSVDLALLVVGGGLVVTVQRELNREELTAIGMALRGSEGEECERSGDYAGEVEETP